MLCVLTENTRYAQQECDGMRPIMVGETSDRMFGMISALIIPFGLIFAMQLILFYPTPIISRMIDFT